MIRYSKKDVIEKYFESEKINQSLLKQILKSGNSAFTKKEQKESKALLLGSIIDLMLTSDEPFHDYYYVGEIQKVTPSEKKVLDLLLERDFKPDEEIKEDKLLEILDITGFYKNLKSETRLIKAYEFINAKYREYYNNKGLTRVEEELWDKIVAILEEANKIEPIRKIFEPQAEANYWHLFQKPLYFEYKDLEMKALLDKLELEFNDKGEIIGYTIIDLKTMEGKVDNFIKNVKKFDYLFQLAFYDIAVKEVFGDQFAKFINKQYKFVVLSSTYPGNAVIYEVDPKYIENEKQRIKEAIDLLKFYSANPDIKVSKEIYENNYKLKLKIDD